MKEWGETIAHHALCWEQNKGPSSCAPSQAITRRLVSPTKLNRTGSLGGFWKSANLNLSFKMFASPVLVGVFSSAANDAGLHAIQFL